MRGLALQIQEGLRRDPHGGDLFIFRGHRGDLAKILWHGGVGFRFMQNVSIVEDSSEAAWLGRNRTP